MDGINPQRLAMINNTPVPTDQRATAITAAPTWTESNNIPLGPSRRGSRLDQAAQDPAHFATRTSPPENSMTPTANTDPNNDTMLVDGMEDDEMDDDLDDPDATTFILDRTTANGADMTDKRSNHNPASASYFQSPGPFSDFGTQDLWQPPADDAEFVLRTAHMNDPIRLFHSACRKIRKGWRCAPSDCLPSGLKRTTPYSLSLLRQLARLSQTIPNASDAVKELLLAQVANRVARLTIPAQGSADIRTVQSPGEKDAEDFILENLDGLMLYDMKQIFCQLRRSSTEGIHLGLHLSESVVTLIQESVDIKARKEAKKEANRANRLANRQQRKADRKAADPRSTKYERSLLHQRRWDAARGFNIEPVHLHRYPLRSRANDALVQPLIKSGVDRADTYRKQRHKQRKVILGQSRLPSERLDAASISPLHRLLEGTDESAAIRGMSLLSLDAQKSLPSLTHDRASEWTDEDEGGVSLMDPGDVPIAQGTMQGLGMDGYPIAAPQHDLAIDNGWRGSQGTRCPECFRLHRKCTHTGTPRGTGGDEQKTQTRTKGYSRRRGGRAKGRGVRVEHVGPRHGEAVGTNAAAMNSNSRGPRMMERMGWSAGTALDKDGEGMLAPVEQRMRQGKAGWG